MTFRNTEKNKDQSKVKRKVFSVPLFAHAKNTHAFMRMNTHTHTHVVNETHHDIVSLHLSFLTGQFLTLQFQTVRQKENVTLVHVKIKHTATHTCARVHTHTHACLKFKKPPEIISDFKL